MRSRFLLLAGSALICDALSVTLFLLKAGRNLPANLGSAAEIPDGFETFWEQERVAAFEQLCKEEQLDGDKLNKLIDRFVYTGEAPLPDPDIIQLIDRPLKLAGRGWILRPIYRSFSNGFPCDHLATLNPIVLMLRRPLKR